MSRMRRDGGVYHVESLSVSTAQSMVTEHHYLHRSASCSHAFGLIAPGGMVGEIVGVVMYGTPASAPVRSGVCGPDERFNVIELTRLWIADCVPSNAESFLIGNTLRRIPKDIVLSYADPAYGHVGTVYQATNWLYTGLSAKRTDWSIPGVDGHGQSLSDRYSSAELREAYGETFKIVARPRKHRYVMLLGDRRRRKELRKKLRYPVLPYPKMQHGIGASA